MSRQNTVHDALRGQAVVPGQASGRVKLARNIAEAGEIDAGTYWSSSPSARPTPFLGVAGGLVSESPTALWETCPALTADYGIPVIVGCECAMALSVDSRHFNLDGSNGTMA